MSDMSRAGNHILRACNMRQSMQFLQCASGTDRDLLRSRRVLGTRVFGTRMQVLCVARNGWLASRCVAGIGGSSFRLGARQDLCHTSGLHNSREFCACHFRRRSMEPRDAKPRDAKHRDAKHCDAKHRTGDATANGPGHAVATRDSTSDSGIQLGRFGQSTAKPEQRLGIARTTAACQRQLSGAS
jgi:hypothetical protein